MIGPIVKKFICHKEMSIRNLNLFGRFLKFKSNNATQIIRNFSKKTNNIDGPYKPVRARKIVKNEIKLASKDPNFEILASNSGFPFVLPGNVGIAWYDTDTTIKPRHDFIMEQIDDGMMTNANIICRVQTCPTVLRKTVCDLFPYRNLETCELSVVTISLKPDLKLLRKNNELETERMAQTFLITAKSVCDKLRHSGYWADFINPFSGRPYLYPNFDNKLYEADEKFRCLDFQIFDIQDCKIISNEEDSSKRRFIGSLFTNAPSKKNHLNNIFTKQ